MVISVVCFAAGHRKVYVGELGALDVHCRKLLRRMVGPPPDANWNGPWHEVFHEWHVRIEQQVTCNGFKLWSRRYLAEYWKFANYVGWLGTHNREDLDGHLWLEIHQHYDSLPGGNANALKIGCGRLRASICGNTIPRILQFDFEMIAQ